MKKQRLGEVLRVVPFNVVKVARCPACSREITPTFSNCPFCGAAIHHAVPAECDADVARENSGQLIHAV